MRKLFLFMIITLLITSIVCFVGCSRDGLGIMDVPIKDDKIPPDDRINPDDWDFADISFYDVDISISDNKPTEIMVTFMTGSHSNTCIFIDEIHQKRNGNIIFIWGTIGTSKAGGGLICGAAVTQAEGQVSLGALSSFADGEYEVIGRGINEKFRVEDDEILKTVRY